MARHAQGWTLRWHNGIGYVRFRLQRKRYEISTRERDPRKAEQAAQQIYADFVSGRVRKSASGALVHPSTPIEDVCADWIEAILPELGEGMQRTLEVYAGHWVEHFDTVGQLTSAGVGDYQRARLSKVQRTTVIKERSQLLRFLTWCVEREILREVPAFPKMPRKATGVRHKQARSKPTVDLSPEETRAVIAALPEWSRTRDGERFAIRARFELAYETGLRPATISRLLWRDVTVAGLHIRAEADKNRWDRVIPLTARAREALDRLDRGKPEEPIFGKHDYRHPFRLAAIAALGEERGKRVNPYDLKHGRVTHLLDDGASVNGVRFLTGTKVALDRYARPTRRAAEQAIGGNSGGRTPSDECEGGDLNPHESYLASTSIKSDRGKARDRSHGDSRKCATSGTDAPLSGGVPPNELAPPVWSLGYAALALGLLRGAA